MASTQRSPRAELARLSLDVALDHADVIAGVAGPGGACVTTLDGERLEGVTAAAAPGGDYAVTLRLRTRVVPLRELADELRRRIVEAAAASELSGRPRSIEVQIVDVGDTP